MGVVARAKPSLPPGRATMRCSCEIGRVKQKEEEREREREREREAELTKAK